MIKNDVSTRRHMDPSTPLRCFQGHFRQTLSFSRMNGPRFFSILVFIIIIIDFIMLFKPIMFIELV